MGNTQIQEKEELLFEGYTFLGQEGKLKLLQEKGTERTFALSEECFINKAEYDAKFKRLTQRQNANLGESILQLVRLWSKQHTGICSHLYKIYALYEYPRVKLIDEIQARRRQGKYFEEEQLFSIMQSCLNCISPHLYYLLLSPHFIFILPQGLLKLLHPHLIDQNARVMYDQKYYYAPQKIQNFSQVNTSPSHLEKEAIFSLAMTILHCVLLQSPTLCYQISMKRFNYRRLQFLLSEAKSLYSPLFHQLLAKMLSLNPYDRPNFDQLQTSLNAFFSNKVSLVSSLYRSGRENDKNQFPKHPQKDLAQNELKNSSAKSSVETLNRIGVSHDRMAENERNRELVEKQPLKAYNVAKQRAMFKEGSTISKKAAGKQNLYSDAKLMNLIREGIQKIKTSNQQRKGKSSLQIVQNSNQFISFSHGKTQLKQKVDYNELDCVQQNPDCTFAVQTYHDNTRFQGMLRNSLKQGYGKLTYPDGVYYEGNFEADTLHGRGALYYGPNRPAYVGQWRHNKFHGKGVLYNQFPVPLLSAFDCRDFSKLGQAWIKYEGEFVQDIKSGLGKIILTNGELMEGTFCKGLLNGPGTFTDLMGNKTSGNWKENVLVE